MYCTFVPLHPSTKDNAGVIVNDKGEMKGSAIQARGVAVGSGRGFPLPVAMLQSGRELVG